MTTTVQGYFLQRDNDANVWEEVDRYIYDNMEYALTFQGDKKRYSGNHFLACTDGTVCISAGDIGEKELAMIARQMNMRGINASPCQIRVPEIVKIKPKRGKKIIYYENTVAVQEARAS